MSTFGRYRLLERLGQGGMAEVFKAKSFGVEGFEKILVIKRILPELASRPGFAAMFIHEAKLAVRLSHANIVQVFDLGLAPGEDESGAKTPDAYYMAMEYVHGLDLATVLGRCRRLQIPIPIPMAVFIASEVAKGLDHAHRRRDEQFRPLGIVHRDVSPHNVLLSYEGEVKVTDFGIAKAAGALPPATSTEGDPSSTRTERPGQRPQHLHGKAGYMSPEQARDTEVDARSDLFSLGTILYECLAGVNPFSAPSSFETLRRVQAAEYPPVDLLRADTPNELLAIVRTAMAKSKEDRFPDAGRMYEALLAFLYGHGGRFGAHELAGFLESCRDPSEGSVSIPISDRIFDADPPAAERTPVVGQRSVNPGAGSQSPAARTSAHFATSTAPEGHPSTASRISVADHLNELGERREVSVLFIEPSRRGGGIGEQTADVIARYGGQLFRQEEEQVVALFGLSEPDGRDTETATRCALVIMRGFDAEAAPSIGIHSGRVHLGTTANGAFEPLPDARLMSLIDDAQKAARMDPCRSILTAPAARLVGAVFEVEQTAAPTDSGTTPSQTAMKAFAVKDIRGPAQTYGKFVGRKEELRKIGEVLAVATKRSARTLTVRGDHGIGKTRLLLEVERRLRKGGYNVGFHVATCPPRGAELPLSGVVAMLHILCGVADGDANVGIMAVQPRLRALGLQEEEVAAVLAALGARVQGGAGSAGTILRHAFGRMVQRLCEDRPHALAWDAAHCMDHESFSILEEVCASNTTSRLVLAFSARAGFSHPLERRAGHTSLDLIDLSATDVERLIALRLGIDSAPDELVRFVRERAGGHPLFIEEVLKSLVGANAVSVADRQLTSVRLVGQELALPKTLRGLVALRVSRLSLAERSALQAASILGDPIDTNVLATMRGEPLASLERSLGNLEAQEFFVRTGPSELRFASPIVPEVVVDALTPEAARSLHDAAASALKSAASPALGDNAVRVARHLYEAGDRAQAASFFAASGARRLEARQMEAATRDYGRAIALSEMSECDPSVLTGWLTGFAAAVRLVRSAPEARELSARVISRVDEAGSAHLKVRARVAAGHLLSSVHCMDIARQYLTEAEEAAGADEGLKKLVTIASAEMAARQGDFARARAFLERLQRLVTDDGDAMEKHKVALHLSQANAASGDRAAALSHLERASALLPRDVTAACERQKLRAFIDYFSRDYDSAARGYERAAEMARAAGLTYEVMTALHNLGEVVFRQKDFARAYGTFQQSLALCDECGFERAGNYNRMFLAYLDGIASATDGEKLLRQGIAYAQANDFSLDVLGGSELLAQLLLSAGKHDQARAEFERARQLAEATGNSLLLADIKTALSALTLAEQATSEPATIIP